jgi:molybdopterin converting factor subunit 1
MPIRVKLFAAARDAAGQDEVTLDLGSGVSIREIREELVGRYRELVRLAPHLLFAVDHDFAADDTRVDEKSEVACLPPVSGG